MVQEQEPDSYNQPSRTRWWVAGIVVVLALVAGIFLWMADSDTGDVALTLVGCALPDEFGEDRAFVRAVNDSTAESKEVSVEIAWYDESGNELETTTASQQVPPGLTVVIESNTTTPAGTNTCEIVDSTTQ